MYLVLVILSSWCGMFGLVVGSCWLMVVLGCDFCLVIGIVGECWFFSFW